MSNIYTIYTPLFLLFYIFIMEINIYKQYRKEKSMSQEEVADAAAISRITYNRMETGKTDPQPWIKRQVADVLGIDLKELTSRN